MKYLSEITNVNKIDYELFNGFMENIGLSDEIIEEINDGIEETNKKIKEKFTYGDVESLMIDKIDKRDVIETLEGLMKANVGDYIIKGINGEFYPCKQFIFLETHEPVEE